jgi:hypothetical protein
VLSILAINRGEAGLDLWQSDHVFAAMNNHPFTGEFGRRYYPAVFGAAASDASFVIIDDRGPLLVVPCSVADTDLNYYGMPIKVFERAGACKDVVERAVKMAFEEFDAIMSRNNLLRASIADTGSGLELSAIGKQCLNRKAAAAIHLSGWCELSGDTDQLRRGLRKSYRSLVNWGRANLNIQYVNSSNPDKTLFDSYQSFHCAVAGRSTRPQESWDVMFEWLARGAGELILASLPSGELVAGTMIVDGAEVSSYASGVYDRAKFDKPLAHWPLWLAITRSRERGMRLFDLGDIPISDVSKKELDIGYFKRGFASKISTWTRWTWKSRLSSLAAS